MVCYSFHNTVHIFLFFLFFDGLPCQTQGLVHPISFKIRAFWAEGMEFSQGSPAMCLSVCHFVFADLC